MIYPSMTLVDDSINRMTLQMSRCKHTDVVALLRGGAYFGLRFSHILNLPLHAVSFSSNKGRGSSHGRGNFSSERIVDKTKPTFEARNILLVDDMVDSGYTIKEAKETYEDMGHTVKVAVMYFKEGSVIEPDFYGLKIEKDAPFIHFPWESSN